MKPIEAIAMGNPVSYIAQFEEARRRGKDQLHTHRIAAYLGGRELARKLFETVVRYREALETEDRDIGACEHLLDIEFARGFTEAFMGALKGVPGLIPPEDREDLADYLVDDIRDHAEAALIDMGDEWVSPWLVHADKLRAEGPNGLKLQFLTIGLFQEYSTFDAGRCLTGLDEDFRAAAVAMLDSFSRHGRSDPHFQQAAESLLGGRAP